MSYVILLDEFKEERCTSHSTLESLVESLWTIMLHEKDSFVKLLAIILAVDASTKPYDDDFGLQIWSHNGLARLWGSLHHPAHHSF